MPHLHVCFWETAINVVAADMRRKAAVYVAVHISRMRARSGHQMRSLRSTRKPSEMATWLSAAVD
jgi:hypothetical protein